MMRALALEKITLKKATFFKKLFAFPYKKSFFWGEEQFVFKFTPQTEVPSQNLFLKIEIDKDKIGILVSQTILKLLDRVLEDIDFIFLPDDIKMAVGESYLTSILQGLEKTVGKNFSLLEISFNFTPKLEDTYWVGFQIIRKRDNALAEGILWGSEYLGSFILECLPLMEKEETKLIVDLPAYLNIIVGITYLSVKELRSIEKNDIILMDEIYFKDNHVILSASNTLKFWAILKDFQLIVEKKMEATNMQEEKVEQQQEVLNKVDDVPIELSFELGKITLSIAELSALQPGYVFELNQDLNQPVEIRANGKLIGKGELLEIDGRIGVRVVEFLK